MILQLSKSSIHSTKPIGECDHHQYQRNRVEPERRRCSLCLI
ncbi:hypothetical protein PU660_26885 [Klebsiella pneumoniae]